jgi:hypothetical protein
MNALLTLLLLLPVGVAVPARAETLEAAIGGRVSRVAEFEFIREEAKKLGARVWLFGGTAASYAHYVKQDLQRLSGDTRFHKDRFDYEYSRIFRSTQDADLVMDGTPQQAEALESALVKKFPYLQGSKSVWEVRLLNQARGDKEPLTSPDFLNQHSDSHSTGMIELTDPPSMDKRVRDIRAWTSPTAPFLSDVEAGKLHFYFSERHAQTTRFKNGLNPPILAAIRYLTKAFQYELEIQPDDRARILRIIQNFNPRRDLKEDYITKWVEKNGPKLIQHAVNIEYATDQLDALGLRKILRAVSKPEASGSLGWWMNKEPLRTRPIGKGFGRTAKSLGIDVISHETRDLLAYESITRAATGEANVLVSRSEGFADEFAAFGNGYYNRVGMEGARGTGITVRSHLHPDARVGSDFRMEGDFVIVTNKAAIRTIAEQMDFDLLGYFKFLSSGNEIKANERALLHLLKRRLKSLGARVTEEQHRQIAELVMQPPLRPVAVKEWYDLPLSRYHLAALKTISDAPDSAKTLHAVALSLLDDPGRAPELNRALLPLLVSAIQRGAFDTMELNDVGERLTEKDTGVLHALLDSPGFKDMKAPLVDRVLELAQATEGQYSAAFEDRDRAGKWSEETLTKLLGRADGSIAFRKARSQFLFGRNDLLEVTPDLILEIVKNWGDVPTFVLQKGSKPKFSYALRHGLCEAAIQGAVARMERNELSEPMRDALIRAIVKARGGMRVQALDPLLKVAPDFFARWLATSDGIKELRALGGASLKFDDWLKGAFIQLKVSS